MTEITITTHNLLSTDEVCEELNCSRMHVWRLTKKKNRLRPIYLGGKPFYPRSEVEALKADEGSKRRR